MSDWTRRLTMTGCGLAMLAVIGCDRAPRGWTPVLEETSTAFLKTETEAVASRVRAAIAHLPSNPESATSELATAEEGLDRLLTYYLPLLEARESAYNAYRHYYLGDSEQATRELDRIESTLTAVAKAGDSRLLREMEEPLEKLEDARVALAADAAEAEEALRALATRLNFLLLRGGLVLAG